ncbi:MAG: hypothetical protein O2782_01040 [bacterium]|nr:hypothetical protein [bacterium]
MAKQTQNPAPAGDQQYGGVGHIPAHDDRPNSGLREGDIPHAEVNDAIRLAPKTVIFGQQTRLRLGLLMEDDTLPRFHAGHDLVKFFYGAIRQLPEVILDGILAAGISVVLVQQRKLLAFRDVRAHQSFHTGRTRRNVYMPEQAVAAAFKRGYDYWALTEVIIKEAYPLLDYILILELVRHMQVRMRQVHLPGISFIKDTLRQHNKHLKDPSARLRAEGRHRIDPKEDEFGEFYGEYAERFKAWRRDILERDPYDVADEVYNEGVSRKWAEWKVDLITHTYNFPTLFELDRDIVHPAAFEQAQKQGLSVEPVTIDDILHDLGDLARFRVGRQVKTEPLLDRLIDAGAPGILGFARLVAAERVTGARIVTEYYHDGYDAVRRFREKLQALCSDLPVDMEMGKIFDELVVPLVLAHAREQLQRYSNLMEQEGGDWRHFLRAFVFQLIGACKPYISDAEKELMLTTPGYYTSGQEVSAWLAVADGLLPDGEAEGEKATLVRILRQLRRHPQYHGLLLAQARELAATEGLDFGDDRRSQLLQLAELIPEPAYRFSSDPQAVRRRADDLQRLQQDDPDSVDQYLLLAGIFVRLDGAPNYADLVAHVRDMGAAVAPVLQEIVTVIGAQDSRRSAIRGSALDLLAAMDGGPC